MSPGARAAGLGLALVLAAAAQVAPLEGRVGEPLPAAGDGAPRGSHPGTNAVPDIAGPGHVTTTNRLWTKTTNIGYMGNPFPELSSDPGGQWPGPSGVEYLFNWSLWVGARNPRADDRAAPYRVTAGVEWRPPSLDPEDRIYRAWEGEPGGLREFDDDGDGRADEEWLNGRDDDGDGRVDEDFAAIGQEMHALDLRDDTPQAQGFNGGETHVPLGLLVHQRTIAFADPGAADFVGVEYEIVNVSGGPLDSVHVGFVVDQDVGPVNRHGYWLDDVPEPRVPQQDIARPMATTDARYDPRTDFGHPAGFCTVDRIAVRGFTVLDGDGDGGETPGASAFLLLGHSTDLRGIMAPRQVGFRSYRVMRATTPYNQGGLPVLDLERFQAMSLREGVDGGGRIVAQPPPPEARADDYVSLCSVGPFPRLAAGASVKIAVALLVAPVDASLPRDDANGGPNPERWQAMKDAALAAQLFYRGRYETPPPGVLTPPFRGWETPVIAPPGQRFALSDCHTDSTNSGGRDVGDAVPTWFDFDCDACTGVRGKAPRNWVVGGPPPSPGLRLTPQDRAVLVEWDNRSEIVADRLTDRPDSTAYTRGTFQIWGYQVWRAGGYRRPPGSVGPADELWEMVAELTLHDALRALVDSVDSDGDGRFDGVTRTAPLLLDRATGTRVFPRDVPPLLDPVTHDTLFVVGERRAIDPQRGLIVDRAYRIPVYPVGRWAYRDVGVLDGFVYYYDVVAVDSMGFPGVGGLPGTIRRRTGRRAAVESEGVVPQSASASAAAVAAGQGVYVVPNPYRGRAAWDLAPSASDPTGSHVDFFRLPAGNWTLRIFTLAGDLVKVIRPDDVLAGGRRQQDGPGDGQVSWDLISRNGQDVASGIYLFSIESDGPPQRGKFVLIR